MEKITTNIKHRRKNNYKSNRMSDGEEGDIVSIFVTIWPLSDVSSRIYLSYILNYCFYFIHTKVRILLIIIINIHI